MLRYRAEQSGHALRNTSLNSPERIAAASVLQGHIREIDGILELVLNLSEPETAAEPQESTNGGR
jgi:hypothetical protein